MPDRDHTTPATARPPVGPPWSPPAPAAPSAATVATAPSPPITGMVTFLSSRRRDGPWQVPPHLRVANIMGTVELDLRQALVSPGDTTIEILTVFGTVEVIVPPGVSVDCDGDAVVGTFELHADHTVTGAGASAPGAPKLRVTGRAYMGSVSVRVRGPDERLLARIGRSLGLRG